MAKSDNNAIKDFIKSQTTPVRIGVPAPVQESRFNEPAVIRQGRPRVEEQKIKMSIYIPLEAKEKLVRIQHAKLCSSFNTIIMEAISDYLRKNEM